MNRRKVLWTLPLLVVLMLGVGGRPTEALSAGHYPEVNIGYTDGVHARTYTAAPNFRQGSDSLDGPKSTISNADATDLYVNFQEDTSGWSIFVVYTTDGTNPHKTNGTCVQGAFSKYNDPDRTWYVTIPSSANTAGATVKYVFYANTGGGLCTDNGLQWANRRVASEAGGVEVSWTEGDAAYEYLVRYCSTTSGNWNTGSTWVGGAVPPANGNIEVCSGDAVTLDTDAAVSSLRVNYGGTFQDDASGNTLTIADGGALINAGAFVAGSGTVAFAGDGSVSGAVTFQHVVLNATAADKGIDLGSNSTINGTFTINAHRYIHTNVPTYGSGSTLKYNTGGVYGRNLEWSATSGAGYPHHVQISNNTGLDLGNGGTGTARAIGGDLIVDAGSGLYMDYGANDMTAALTVNGSVTINGTLSLSEQPGGNLQLAGNWSNNGTFNCRGRQVAFNGSGAQGIGGSAATTFDYLLINNAAEGEVTLVSDITVKRELKINDSSAEISAGAATITMQGDASSGPVWINNGTFRRDTGTVAFTGENDRHARVLGAAVTTFNDVTLNRNSGGSGNFGVDFYDHDTARRAHIAGTLTLNVNTFVASEEDGSSTSCVDPEPYPLLDPQPEADQCDGTPIYDPGSTLYYNNSGTFNSAAEWWPDDADPVCATDKGMPYNVVIDNSTAVNINAAFVNNGHAPSYGAGSNKTACGSVTIASGSTLQSTTGILSVKNDWVCSGTFTHNSGTVRLNGSIAQSGDGRQTVASNSTFYNLILDMGSGVTAAFGANEITILHDLTKNTSGTMDPETSKFIFTGSTSALLGSGAKIFYDLEIASGTTNHLGGGGVHVYHDFTNNGTFVEGADQGIYFDGGSSGSMAGSGTTTFGRVEVSSSSTVYAGAHSFNVAGNIFQVASGSFFHGESATVTFQNTSGTDLSGAGSYNFNHLVIDSGATLLGVDTTGNGKTYRVAGTWTNNGAYTHNSGKVEFNGASAQTIGGSSVTTFYDLTVNNASGVALGQHERAEGTLYFTAGRLVLGAYNLTLGSAAPAAGGTLNASNMVVADSTGALCKEYASAGSYLFPVGDVSGPDSTADYSPGTLNFTSVTGSGTACLRVIDAEHEDNAAIYKLTRYWPVSASGFTAFTCTATFAYVDADTDSNEGALLGLKCDDGTCAAHDPVDAVQNLFTISDMGSFSDFTAGGSPLAVRLTSLTARPAASGILLAWETAGEEGNIGFHLYRSTRLDALGERVNAALIPSRAPGGGPGAAYEYLDTTAEPDTPCYYTLIDVDAFGRGATHGPVAAALWRAYLPLVGRW